MIVTGGPVFSTTRDSLGRYLLARQWTHKIGYVHILDGSSNTFLAGEIHIPKGRINEAPFNGSIFNGNELDGHSRIGGPGIPILTENDEAGGILGFGSSHTSGCNFVRADGSTRTFSPDIDTVVLANLCHRADGEVIGAIE